jgi:hypothetical protein
MLNKIILLLACYYSKPIHIRDAQTHDVRVQLKQTNFYTLTEWSRNKLIEKGKCYAH